MIILTDVDGVLADFIGHVATRCDVRGHAVKEWDLSKCLSQEELERVDRMSKVRHFCSDIPWYPGAREFLTSLVGIPQAEVFAVTAPWHSETWSSERRLWLAEHLQAWRVISCSGKAKHLVSGDVLIEDHPGTAVNWLRSHPNGYAVLIDRPWNQPESQTYRDAKAGETEYRLLRAHSYDEALGLVEGIRIVYATRERV